VKQSGNAIRTINDKDPELNANDFYNRNSLRNSRRKSSTGSFKKIKRKLSESGVSRIFSRQHSTSSVNKAMLRRDAKVGRTIFVIFLVIIICSIPVVCAHIAEAKAGKVENKSQFLLLHVLYWLQFCINVFVYVIFNQQYRNAYIECLALIDPSWNNYLNKKLCWEREENQKKEKPSRTNSIRKTSDVTITMFENEKDEFLPEKKEKLAAVLESQSRENLNL
ncbi:unnamed protein product, partial [Meganyctiphanes norvegica]